MTSSIDVRARELLEKALTHVRALKAELHQRDHGAIAIVGLAGRYPDAPDLEALWRGQVAGRSAIAENVEGRLGPLGNVEVPRHAALVADVDRFDYEFFGIREAEARAMDPQHRMLLEVSWDALADARLGPHRRSLLTGVFFGLTTHDHAERAAVEPDVYSATGNGGCFAAGRLSHWLGLSGPSMVVDTACSSSLVAVHLACAHLRSRECDVALAGGASAILSRATMEFMARTEALSPNGQARTFDAAANGYVRGEGCGVVVLKRLEDALSEGDAIWAVIRGSAVNHDGPSSTLTAPNPDAQAALVRAALKNAELSPADLGYVETHGTGTRLGDPIEVEALAKVLGTAGGTCYLGSIKSNVGHLEAAAGIAGLTRAVLALHHETIPPQASFRTPNPEFDFSASRLTVPTTAMRWPRNPTAAPRRAGVSAFGMSGTNAHVVVEEAADPGRTHVGPHPYLLALEAATEPALRVRAAAYTALLCGGGLKEDDFHEVSREAAATRMGLRWRAVVDLRSPDLQGRLHRLAQGARQPGIVVGEAHHEARPVVLVFGRDFAPAAADAGLAPHPWEAELLRNDPSPQGSRVAALVGFAAHLRDLGVTAVSCRGVGEGVLAAAHLAARRDGWPAERADTAPHTAPIYLVLGHGVDVPVGALRVDMMGAADAAEALAFLHVHGVDFAWERVVGWGGPRGRAVGYPWGGKRLLLSTPGHAAQPTAADPETQRGGLYTVSWTPSTTSARPAQGLRGRRVLVFGAPPGSEDSSDAVATLRAAGAFARVAAITDVRSEKFDDALFFAGAGGDKACRAALPTILETPGVRVHAVVPIEAQGIEERELQAHLAADVGEHVAAARLTAWMRTLLTEDPERVGGLCHVAPGALEAALQAMVEGGLPREVALRDGSSLEPRLVHCEPSSTPIIGFDPRGVYLVTGGLGGIGQAVTRWLLSRGARDILLLGRRAAFSTTLAALRAGAPHGAYLRYRVVDVADEAALAGTLEDVLPALRGIFHTAGIAADVPMARLSPEVDERVRSGKERGAENLHRLTRSAPCLEHFVLFSSLAALLPGRGQGAYAAANLALDTLARTRAAKRLPALSIQWGLWDGPGLPSEEERGRLVELGLAPLPEQRALALLEEAMVLRLPVVAAADVDWERCHEVLEGTGRTLLDDLVGARKSGSDQPRAVLSESMLRAALAHVLGVAPSGLDLQRSAAEMGLDSLAAIKLRRALGRAGMQVSLAALLTSPTLAALTVTPSAVDATRRPDGSPEQADGPREPVQKVPLRQTDSPSRLPPEPGTRRPSGFFPVRSREEAPGSNASPFVVHIRRPEAQKRLFCFPFAGGGPAAFGDWATDLPPELEVASLQLAGRGGRLGETPTTDLPRVLAEVVPLLEKRLDKPYAFLGHCFGALLQYELTHALAARGLPLPQILFVSGARAPQCYTSVQLERDIAQFSPEPPKPMHELGDEAVVTALRELAFAGNAEALSDPEVQRLLLPAVRADFALANTYRHMPREPLPVPIVAVGGRSDPYVNAEQILGWREHTSAGFVHEFWPGDHYFLGPERERWLDHVRGFVAQDPALRAVTGVRSWR